MTVSTHVSKRVSNANKEHVERRSPESVTRAHALVNANIKRREQAAKNAKAAELAHLRELYGSKGGRRTRRKLKGRGTRRH